MLKDRDVTIIGAGLGGLAAALALARRGARVRVLEQAPEIAEVGAGIQVSPNGLCVLDALGLGEAAREAGMRSAGVRLRDYRHGATVAHLDLLAESPDQTFLLFHRADLIDLLAKAARDAGIDIVLGRKVAEIAETADEVNLTFADGTSEAVPCVVGADGLHSRLRPVLNGPAKPFFTGMAAWRAVVPAPEGMAPEATVYMGPGKHVVTYPLRGGTLANIVAVEEVDDWVEEGWSHEGNPYEMRQAFAEFPAELRMLLDEVKTVHLWGLFRHPVAEHWHGQRSALLGDAAHPTLPFLAQGANMAFEDAWVLADCLASSDLPGALAAYQARRRSRVVRVIEAANANARNYHLRNPLVRTAAHALLRVAGAVAPGQMVRQFDWVYRFDVTRA